MWVAGEGGDVELQTNRKVSEEKQHRCEMSPKRRTCVGRGDSLMSSSGVFMWKTTPCLSLAALVACRLSVSGAS